MARFTGIMLGIIATQLIRIILFCTMLYMLFSPISMWIYIIACCIYGFVTALKINKKEKEMLDNL